MPERRTRTTPGQPQAFTKDRQLPCRQCGGGCRRRRRSRSSTTPNFQLHRVPQAVEPHRRLLLLVLRGRGRRTSRVRWRRKEKPEIGLGNRRMIGSQEHRNRHRFVRVLVFVLLRFRHRRIRRGLLLRPRGQREGGGRLLLLLWWRGWTIRGRQCRPRRRRLVPRGCR